MEQYNSFKQSKNKTNSLYNKSIENESKINELKSIKINCNSINFLKKVITIPILDNQFYNGYLENIIVIDLINMPEWLINHINVLPVVSLIDDINDDTVYSDFSYETTNGLLKIGDIRFSTELKKWFAKTDGNNYKLKIFLYIDIDICTSVIAANPTSYTSSSLPFKLNLSLKILNPKIYENNNGYKS